MSSVTPNSLSDSFQRLLRVRQSIRVFQARAVEEEKLQYIINATNRAPSAGNLQAYEIVVIREERVRNELVTATFNQKFIAAAPIHLIFCAHQARSQVKYGEVGGKLYSLQDATIACAYAEMAIAARGLGTVWIGALDVPVIRRITGIPEHWDPIALLPIGYRAEEPPPTVRRSISDLVHEQGVLRNIPPALGA